MKKTMTLWVQPMSNARDCIHGSLARKCDICDRDEDIYNLKAELERMEESRDFWKKLAMDLTSNPSKQWSKSTFYEK